MDRNKYRNWHSFINMLEHQLFQQTYRPVAKDKQLIVHPSANNKYSIGCDPCSTDGSHSAIVFKRSNNISWYRSLDRLLEKSKQPKEEVSWIEYAHTVHTQVVQDLFESIFNRPVYRDVRIETDKNGVGLFDKMIKNDISTTTTNTSMDSKEVTDI